MTTADGECFRAYDDAAESFDDHSAISEERPATQRLFELDTYRLQGVGQGAEEMRLRHQPQVRSPAD